MELMGRPVSPRSPLRSQLRWARPWIGACAQGCTGVPRGAQACTGVPQACTGVPRECHSRGGAGCCRRGTKAQERLRAGALSSDPHGKPSFFFYPHPRTFFVQIEWEGERGRERNIDVKGHIEWLPPTRPTRARDKLQPSHGLSSRPLPSSERPGPEVASEAFDGAVVPGTEGGLPVWTALGTKAQLAQATTRSELCHHPPRSRRTFHEGCRLQPPGSPPPWAATEI
uniref:Uncharacterized protein n=1 Tax=Molossus molossus TaxID=27622 RepID=A0A7J8C951_MOLMO|nr:hypothetical protein HJG59_009989 [Molossus molossus]